MTNPVFRCPHCKKDVEIELTKQGELRLNGYPLPKSKVNETQDSLPSEKP